MTKALNAPRGAMAGRIEFGFVFQSEAERMTDIKKSVMKFDHSLMQKWSEEYLHLLQSGVEPHVAIPRIKSSVVFSDAIITDTWWYFESTESSNVYSKYADSVNPPYKLPERGDDDRGESIFDIGTRI